MRIYTLGTDHRPQHEFTRLLYKYSIQVVFDVRRTPEAQEEYFRRGPLELLLTQNRVDYVYLGNEMGGPRDGDLKAWQQTEDFRRGVSIILRKVPNRVCCILCAERTPEYCHRLAITGHLAKQGVEVIHLLEENRLWQPPAVGARPGRPGPGRPRPPRPHEPRPRR
jgi:uncharacterized protein (DUF488 family)